MKFSWKKFLKVFAFTYGFLLVMTCLVGCSAAFLGAISALLPALEASVSAAVAFVVALEGKTVSASVSAAIQKWGTNVASLITSLQDIITAAKGAATASVISQIQAAMQAISSAMSSILPDFDVTDSATVSKFTALLNLGIGLVSTILGFIPLIQTALARVGVTNEQLKAEDQEATAHIKNLHKGFQDAYKIVRDTPTASGQVNAALNGLPAGLP
jgi:hypothetical protein